MVLRSLVRALTAAALCLTATAAAPQVRALSVEDVYGYDGWKRFNGSSAVLMNWVPAGDPWLSDTHHLWPASSEATAPGAAVAILGRDREATATDAAGEQPGQQETGPMQVIEGRRCVWVGQWSRHHGLAALHGLPQLFINDAQMRHLGHDLAAHSGESREATSRLGVLVEALPTPHLPAEI